MPLPRRCAIQARVGLLAFTGAFVGAELRAQQPTFTVLSAYVEDTEGGTALQPNRSINIVFIANNSSEFAARNARLRVELRSPTVAFVNEPALRRTDVVLGDFDARVSQPVFVPVVATAGTASIEVVVTPMYDGQLGAAASQTHRFPTGFPRAAAPSPAVPTTGAAPTPSVPSPGTDSRRASPARPAAGTRQTRAQLMALASDPARMLRPSQAVSGVLDRSRIFLEDGTPVDLWYYQGVAGEQVVITQTSPTIDSYLILGRVGGSAALATDDDGGGGLNSRITHRLTESGTYVIIANVLGENSFGNYSLTLTSDRPAAAAARGAVGSLASVGRPLTFAEVLTYPMDPSRLVRMGATVSGRLTTADPQLSDNTYFHAYYFNGFEGDRIAITLSSRAFDAYLHFGQLGGSSSLATDDDSGGGRNARITVTLPATGTYVILANVLSGNDRGAYTLEVRSP